jgi:flagellar basal-body rod modification protein FlgD
MSVDTNIIDSLNGSSAAAAKKQSASEEMGERFMTLFLAQLRNQDPLNPMENAEMTSQLAQMNMVSGLETLNATMQTLLSSYNEALSLQAANLIGKNVLVPGKQITLTDEGALFGINLTSGADRVDIIIQDASGFEVAKKELGQQNAGSQAFYWDGSDNDGNKLPPGNYTFSIASTLDGEAVQNQPLQAGMVSALIRDGASGFLIEVAGLGAVALDQVRQVF